MTKKDTTLWDFHQDENREHLKDAYPRQNMLAKTISNHVVSWGKILEIWFWDGYLLDLLVKQWYVCIWQDISARNIELTQKQWGDNWVNYVLWTLDGKIIAEDASVDAIIASEVLEHMTNEELEIIVNEVYRCLKKWWIALFTFPARENLRVNTCSCPNCGEVFHKWWHKQYWDNQKIQKTFEQFASKNISEFVSRVAGKDFSSTVLWYLKTIGSHVLWINKSYKVLLVK